jgi:hypothetical protein
MNPLRHRFNKLCTPAIQLIDGKTSTMLSNSAADSKLDDQENHLEMIVFRESRL